MAYANIEPFALTDPTLDPQASDPSVAPYSPVPRHSNPHQQPGPSRPLGGMLQTTLDLEEIINIFAQESRASIAFDQIRYRNRQHNIDIGLGDTAPHSCNYRLLVDREYQGEVTVRRHRPFKPEEQRLIEDLLAELVYPLRNALLYKSALEAAQKDPLTGIGNRAALDSTLAREIELAKRHNTPLSLIAIDIDHFKRINDTHGHSFGDQVIRTVARNAAATIRSCDMLFRYGGEEFVILLSNTDTEGAMLLAERLRQRIAKLAIDQKGAPVAVTISMGIATSMSADSPDTLFIAADKALYEAKQKGRNRCCTYTCRP